MTPMSYVHEGRRHNVDVGWSLFSFSGRLSLKPYWGFMSALVIPNFLWSEFATFVLPEALAAPGGLGLRIAIVWPVLALAVKRIHDRGRSTLFLLLFIVPLLNLWLAGELLVRQGTLGQNEYGPDPQRDGSVPSASPGHG